MIDISSALVTSAQTQRSRFSAESAAVLTRVTTAVSGQVDWDPGAGENWAIIRIATELVAFLCMPMPLALVAADYASAIQQAAPELTIVSLDNLTDNALRASEDALAAFGLLVEVDGERIEPDLFDPEHFSAEDLWFCTI